MEFDFYAPWDDPARDNCAIYLREGAIIPKREVELYRHGKVNPIAFSIYPGRDSSYKLYLDDDGVSNKAETAGEYRLTEISHQGKAACKTSYDWLVLPKQQLSYSIMLPAPKYSVVKRVHTVRTL